MTADAGTNQANCPKEPSKWTAPEKIPRNKEMRWLADNSIATAVVTI
jgi:hypothetical protein